MFHKMVFIKRILFYCLLISFFLGCHAQRETETEPAQEPLSCDSFLIGQEFSLKNPQREKTAEGEYVILADSLSYSPDYLQSSSHDHLLYISILIAIVSSILFIYKRRSYSKQVHSLEEDKQSSEQALSQKIDIINERRNQLFELYMKTCPIYEEIMQLLHQNKGKIYAHELLTPEKWDELFFAINSHANHFTTRLQDEYPLLKIEDIRFCCLIKIGLNYSDIACILGRTPNMMYKRRNIIAKRMELNDSNKVMDKYIVNF